MDKLTVKCVEYTPFYPSCDKKEEDKRTHCYVYGTEAEQWSLESKSKSKSKSKGKGIRYKAKTKTKGKTKAKL